MPIIARKILSASTGNWVPCCWFECTKDGYELYKAVFHEHAKELPCDHPLSEHVNFVFCSERHKQYYLHSHIDMGNLPPGYQKAI